MKTIVFASKNRGKIREIKELLEDSNREVLSLYDYPEVPGIEEDGATFLENALKKARVVSEYTGETVLADDSGLEVDALEGRPGVRSARYAGPDATDEANNERLLSELEGVPQEKRTAAFRCVLVLYYRDGTYRYFDGRLEGVIGSEPRGSEGFGYDPVFIVPAHGLTVAELGLGIKNTISHRARALTKLKNSLQ